MRTLAQPPRPSWLRRIGWFALIWGLSVVALGLAAGAMRLGMSAAGLTP